MGKYNTTVIEEAAVSAIENECRKYSEYLHPSIPKGDKGISWDGFIEISETIEKISNKYFKKVNIFVDNDVR